MIAFVQLSDIHIREGRENPVLTHANLIVAAMRTFVAPATDLYLILSGDTAFAGKAKEYELAASFIGELEHKLNALNGPKFIGTVGTAGNHDCDFSSAGDLRESTIAGVTTRIEKLDVTGKAVTELLMLQQNFFNFLSLVVPNTDSVPRLSSQLLPTGGRYRIMFRCLNTAWVSLEKEKPGQLFFPPSAIPPAKDCDLVVTVLHHPYGWLEPNNSRVIRRSLETSSDLILTGHEHESDYYSKTGSDGATTNFVEAAALFDLTVKHNGFNVILLDPTASTYQVAQFFWNGELYEQQPIITGIFARNQNLLEHQFQNNEAFRISLDFLGAPFIHPEKTDLKLSDLFVYPDLRITDYVSGNSDRTVRSGRVLQYVAESQKLRICGPSNSGRTSLAKTLYRDLLQQKRLVPVLLNGTDFSGVSHEAVVGVISRAFKKQYSEKLYTRFSQLENDERIFIIDDWQNLPLNADGERVVLEALTKYGGRLILISDETEILKYIQQFAKSEVFAGFSFCEIKQFGYSLRNELITKWILLGKEFQIDDLELSGAISSAEHLLDTLVMSGIVPSYPMFVFSVLHASAETIGSNTNYGSFGHIHEQLITKRLGIYGQRLVGAKLTLLSRVAFKMHVLGRNFISEQVFQEIEEKYTSEYAVAGNVADWRKEFVDSKIIDVESHEVTFTYKYAYYFLLAWYFHDGISNAVGAEDLKAQLRGMVDAAHDESNAQSLIFYLYLSKDRDLIEHIVKTAHNIFANVEKCDNNKDFEFANKLCSRHPQMLAPSVDYKENRKEQNELKDRAMEDKERTKLSEQEEQKRNLTIDSAFQLLDVMGQVVRNFPLELRADLKREIIRESYLLGLRLEKSFLSAIEQNCDEIVRSIQTFLRGLGAFSRKSEEDIAYTSNVFLVNLVEGVSGAIIKRVSFSVGIRELRATYQQIRDDTGDDDISMRLIDLAINLEHFGKIPVPDVEALRTQLRTNIVGYTILRTLVAEFIALFPCDYKTRQRMEALLEFKPNDPKMLLDKRVRALPAKSDLRS